MNRIVEPEVLDELSPADPRALRSRRDIRRLNALMGHHRLMAGALRAEWNGEALQHLVELGAGDGHFLFEVARRLPRRWRRVEATLVDRLEVFDPRMQGRFEQLGWRVEPSTADAIEWLQWARAGAAGTIINNLLLHQFESGRICALFSAAAKVSRVFVAIEPRRSRWPLWCCRLLRFIGCGPVTRHDAAASVRAGFRDTELSALWPEKSGWRLFERPAGLFSHLFVARQASG